MSFHISSCHSRRDLPHCLSCTARMPSKVLTNIISSDFLASLDLMMLRCLFDSETAMLYALGGAEALEAFYDKCKSDHELPGAREELQTAWITWMQTKYVPPGAHRGRRSVPEAHPMADHISAPGGALPGSAAKNAIAAKYMLD